MYPNNGSKLGKFQAAMQIRRSSKLNCKNILAVGYFLSNPNNKVVNESSLGLIDICNAGQKFAPASTLSDGNGGYIGAFRDSSDNWLAGWTNFDPQNTAY